MPLQADAPRTMWPLPARLAFRFSCIYWLLYFWPSPGQVSFFDLLPFGGIGDRLKTWLAWPLMKLSHLTGVYLFHLSGQGSDWHATGSGDTAMNYVLVFCILVLAASGTFLWSLIDERRGRPKQYRTAFAWLHLLLRFVLAVTLFGYGFAKVFPGQFGPGPGLNDLSKTYGETSPMHVLWFFMGLSRPYAIFSGLAEVVPGVLLLFRRTATLGALGSAAVMLNVAMLNFCFDVPVKLYSTHLFLLSVFLLLPDAAALWRLFVRGQPAELEGIRVPRTERKALRIANRAVFALFVLLVIWVNVLGGYLGRNTLPQRNAISGVWAVDQVTGWPDATPPQTVVIDGGPFVQVRTADGKTTWWRVEFDPKTLVLRFPRTSKPSAWTWQPPAAGKTAVQGTWAGAPVALTLHRTDPGQYPLLTRGFRWVQENPYNR